MRISLLALALLCQTLASVAAAHARTVNAVVTLPGTGDRGIIRYRITARTTGKQMPILLFSHGAGYSGDDYQRLAAYWAEHGFVVIQPTHLDARAVALAADDPRRPAIWRSRRDDLIAALDQWPALVRQRPALLGRADPTRVVAAGHSYGGHTAALLVGMRVKNAEPLDDPRIRGVVLLSPPGGYDGLASDWQSRAPYLDADWSTIMRPMLVVIGSLDRSEMSPRDAGWHADAFHRSMPGNKCLVEFAGAGHFIGGVGGRPMTNPQDPASPRTVAIAKRLSWKFLRAFAGDIPLRSNALAQLLPGGSDIVAAHCR